LPKGQGAFGYSMAHVAFFSGHDLPFSCGLPTVKPWQLSNGWFYYRSLADRETVEPLLSAN
jgi:hypothetical protein